MGDQGEKNITKNTAFYITALIIQKIFSFTYFSILAANLGTENIGKYFLAISFASIFHIFIDLGLINILIRDIAREEQRAQKLFSYILAIKLPLAVVVFVLINLISQLLGYSSELKVMIALTSIIMLIDNFIISFYGIFRAKHNLIFESLGTIIFQIIVFSGGLTLLKITKQPKILLLALLFASLINFIYSALLVKLKLKLSFKPIFNFFEVKKLLKETLPFAWAGIFTKVYAYIDTIFLSLFVGSQAIGYYSLPYKMVFSLQFIPLALMASLYPIFSSLFNFNKNSLSKIYEQAIFFLLLIILPLAFGSIIIADQLITTVYGKQFQPSIFSLQILMVGLIFVFLNFPVGNLLNACRLQKINTKNVGLIMLFNIILNFILIKIFDFNFLGASFASTISSLLLFAINFNYSLKLINFDFFNFFKKMLKLMLCTLIMVVCLLILKNQVFFVFNILIGMTVYAISILLTGCLKIADLKIFVKSIVKKGYEENPLNHA